MSTSFTAVLSASAGPGHGLLIRSPVCKRLSHWPVFSIIFCRRSAAVDVPPSAVSLWRLLLPQGAPLQTHGGRRAAPVWLPQLQSPPHFSPDTRCYQTVTVVGVKLFLIVGLI